MKLRNHEINTTIGSLTKLTLVQYFMEAMEILECADAQYEVLSKFESGEIDDMDLFDELDLHAISDWRALLVYTSNASSLYSPVNKYLLEMVDVLKHNKGSFGLVVDLAVPPNQYSLAVLKDSAKNVASGIAYALYYDFDIEECGDEVCDDIVFMYCNKSRRTVEEVVSKIKAMREKYPMKLLVFEEHPELEEEFVKVAGPWLSAIPEYRLTLQDVRDILDGKISIESYVASLEVE